MSTTDGRAFMFTSWEDGMYGSTVLFSLRSGRVVDVHITCGFTAIGLTERTACKALQSALKR